MSETVDTTTVARLASKALAEVRGHFSQLRAQGTREDEQSRRYLLGITGVGGSGKSTLAQKLAEQINRALPGFAAVLPMDGFHLPNEHLDRMGLRDRKGAPETIDADGFIETLAALRETPRREVLAPRYDRTLHEPIEDALVIDASAKLVIVEGNYLLIRRTPWHQVAPLLDTVWFLDTPIEEAMRRIRERHIAGGRGASDADAHIARTDWPNAELILETKDRADELVRV